MTLQEYVKSVEAAYGFEAAVSVAEHLEEILDVEGILAAEEANAGFDSAPYIEQAIEYYDEGGRLDLEEWADYEHWIDLSEGVQPDTEDGDDQMPYLVWSEPMEKARTEFEELHTEAASRGLELTPRPSWPTRLGRQRPGTRPRRTLPTIR